jgi:hypothetical protein
MVVSGGMRFGARLDDLRERGHRFEKRNGVWKISHRTGMTDWTRLEAPSSAGFDSIADAQLGKRGKKDMVYRARQLYL